METEQEAASEASEAPASEKMSVVTWFSHALKENKKLRNWHFDAVYAFFKHKNISDLETKETFDKMLKAFGF